MTWIPFFAIAHNAETRCALDDSLRAERVADEGRQEGRVDGEVGRGYGGWSSGSWVIRSFLGYFCLSICTIDAMDSKEEPNLKFRIDKEP